MMKMERPESVEHCGGSGVGVGEGGMGDGVGEGGIGVGDGIGVGVGFAASFVVVDTTTQLSAPSGIRARLESGTVIEYVF